MAVMAESRKCQWGSEDAASPSTWKYYCLPKPLGWTMAELTLLVAAGNQPDGTLAHLDCSPMPCCKLGSDSMSGETALGNMARRWTLVWVVEPSWRQ